VFQKKSTTQTQNIREPDALSRFLGHHHFKNASKIRSSVECQVKFLQMSEQQLEGWEKKGHCNSLIDNQISPIRRIFSISLKKTMTHIFCHFSLLPRLL
jgi:hypothetical protein